VSKTLPKVTQSKGEFEVKNLPLEHAALVSRAKNILLTPDAEWAKVATETDQPQQVFIRHALPMLLIGPVAGMIGSIVFGGISPVAAVVIGIVAAVLAAVSLWVVSFVANMLSPQFGGTDNFPAAFRLVAYSQTAAWLAGIFQIVPMLGILGLLGLYSLYLLYKGASPVMGVPQDKAIIFTVVTVIVAAVAMVLASVVGSLISAPFLLASM
jgi:hypothetical protein